MKLVTYLDGHLRVGAVVDSRVVDLSERFDSMLALIEEGEPALEEARSPRRPIRWLRSPTLSYEPRSHIPGGTSSVWGGTT